MNDNDLLFSEKLYFKSHFQKYPFQKLSKKYILETFHKVLSLPVNVLEKTLSLEKESLNKYKNYLSELIQNSQSTKLMILINISRKMG